MRNRYSMRRYGNRYVIYPQYSNCRRVFNNSNVIDALVAISQNCDKLRINGVNTCSQSFKDAVNTELQNQMNKSVYIGTTCSQVSPIYLSTRY